MLRKIFLVVLVTSFAWLFSAQVFAALPSNIQQIYFFGDSLTDMGNASDAPVTNREVGPIYPGATTWAGFFAKNYYGLNATPSRLGGNDYAISGEETSGIINNEIAPFLQAHNPAAENPATTLYVIWIGANDYLHMQIPPNADRKTVEHILEVAIFRGISNNAAAIDKLYTAGARNFLVIGMPDIAYTPQIVSQQNMELFFGTMLACQSWNQALFNPDAKSHGPLAGLKLLHPDIKIYYYNLFVDADHDVLGDIVNNPSAYNFPGQILFKGQAVDNVVAEWSQALGTSNSDNNPDNYMFFDEVHPDTHIHYIMAQKAYLGAQLF